MQQGVGLRVWAIAEGHIPSESTGPEPQFTSHDPACLLNASDQDAHVEVTVYLSDREPSGPYSVTVPARRMHHVRFNELDDPEPIPKDTDYSRVIVSMSRSSTSTRGLTVGKPGTRC